MPSAAGFRAAAVGAAALFSLTGCTGGSAGDLVDPVEQARAAVRSERLALDLLGRRHVTSAVVRTVANDMTDELASAETAIVAVEVKVEQVRLRDASLAAVRTATSASLAIRDCLRTARDTPAPCASGIAPLQASASTLDVLLAELRRTS
jgi:hypothetical protein